MHPEIVGIIGGKGKMGKFFARFFEANGFQVIISDRGSKLSNVEVAAKADIVLISVPIEATEAVIEEVGPHVRKEGLLMDVTSIKEPMVKKMMKVSRSAVLGCHPMFAPTNLLKGQVIIFCPGRGEKWQTRLRRLFEEHGAEVRILPAEKHDTLMTIIQGLMHFLDITAAKTLKATGIPVEEYFSFRSPSYRLKLDLMGRTLYQDSGLYGNIQIQNPKTTRALRLFLRNAEKLEKIVAARDMRGFTKFWNDSRDYLGDFARVCQQESDDLIDFLSAATPAKISKDQEEKRGRLGILGPENTFSHLAALKFRPDESPIVFFKAIPEIFAAFSARKIESMLVPIENKIHGTVRETLDGLFECPEEIQAIFRLPIHFVLGVLPGGKMNDLKRIYSHPQALSQCSLFLRSKFPEAELVSMDSTTQAIQEMLRKRDPHAGVICSEEGARDIGLKIVMRDLANSGQNETWFAYLSHERRKFSAKKSILRSSIVFFFDQDSPGTLASVLQDFAEAKINLTKIESRPAGHVFGDYLFFLDFEGTIYNDLIQEVLTRIERKVAKLKVLGTYPVIEEL